MKDQKPKNEENSIKNLWVPLLLFVGVAAAAFLITFFVLKSS